MTGSLLFPASASPHSMRIAIIGAGLAGLTAAIHLYDHGFKPVIYEANHRVGGRVYSRKDGWLNGQCTEWGAELIDSTHTIMHQLVHRFGLELEDRAADQTPSSQITYYLNKQYYSHADITAEFRSIYPHMQTQMHKVGRTYNAFSYTPYARELDDTDASTWLANLLGGSLNSPLATLLEGVYITENGAELHEQSALSILSQLIDQPAEGFSLLGNSDEKYHIRGGNDQLPQAMADHLPAGSIHFGYNLRSVKQNSNNSYTLYFHNIAPIVADIVILAVPAAILQNLDVKHAGFTADKFRTIHAIRTGHCTKLNLQFTHKTWLGSGTWPGISTGEVFTDLPMQQIWEATRCQPGETGILIQYAGGEAAKKLNTPAGFTHEPNSSSLGVIAEILPQIDHIYPHTSSQWNHRYSLSTWHNNPYSLGAYTYSPVGYLTRYSGKTRQRQGNIFFTGEYCSEDYIGFMNGAAEEGIKVAREIIRCSR